MDKSKNSTINIKRRKEGNTNPEKMDVILEDFDTLESLSEGDVEMVTKYWNRLKCWWSTYHKHH